MNNIKPDLQPYRGTRDLYPEDKRQQLHIFAAWQRVLDLYGYEPYETPALEPLELYQLRHQGNQEILQEQIYSFTDRGQRAVAVRPEMTPSLARLVAQRRQHLTYPLRWYSIPDVWRYERPQRGRSRQHWQLNVDLMGIDNPSAEYELFLIINDLMAALGAKTAMYSLRLSSRSVLEAVLSQELGLSPRQISELIPVIDKQSKLTDEEFKGACQRLLGVNQQNTDLVAKLRKLLKIKDFNKLPAGVKESAGGRHLKVLLGFLEAGQFRNWSLDLSIVRGFDYYTGVVFEVFDEAKENERSLIGGGRYDHLLESFGVEPLAMVGFGMGDIRTLDFLKAHQLLPGPNPLYDIYVVLIDVSYAEAQPLVRVLRDEGVKVIVDSTNRKTAKKTTSALGKQVRYLLFMGPQELADGQFALRHIDTQQEDKLSIERIVSRVLAKT